MPQMFPDDTGFIAVIPADDTSQDAQIGDTLAFDYDKKQFVIVDGTQSCAAPLQSGSGST